MSAGEGRDAAWTEERAGARNERPSATREGGVLERHEPASGASQAKVGGDVRRTVRLFRRFAVGQRRSLVFAAILLTFEAVTAVAEPPLLGYLIDFLIGKRSALPFASSFDRTVAVLAAAIIGLAAINSLTDSLAEIALAKSGRTLGYNLRNALFGHLQKLSLAFHVRRRTGDVLTRITQDVTALEDFVVNSVSDLFGSVLLIAGILGFLVTQSWQVALFALVLVPVLASVSNVFARRIKAAAKQLRAREGDLASAAQEMLTSIGVVQTYGRAGYEQRRFAERSQKAMDAVFRTARLEAAFSFTVAVLEGVVIAAVIWVGAVLIGEPAITPGTLVIFILLIQQMFKPTRRIIKEWNTFGKIYASAERISELLDRVPAVQDAPDAVEAPALRGDIEFDDVSFAYQPALDEASIGDETRLALDSVSFTIPAGQVVALVGHSGAGKSTVAQLLPRLYDPHAGAVLLDGQDIRRFTIESLRAQISMVLQETMLFSGTVAENIAYGRVDASPDDVIAAAKQANAHDFITALPQGYDAPLGERAATLSGGQRQRLAIARAFIRDAPILVLDEPTTGLDAESSDLVLQALRTLVRGKTALIISHDFNLIRGVDRVLVVSAGRILEEGPPADLLASGGLYADLYARQFGEAAEEAAPVVLAAAARAPGLDGDVAPAERRSAFETVLLAALPLPASADDFRVLSGRGTPSVNSTVAEPDLDPLQAGRLRSALPRLADALDATAVAPSIQGLLAEGWTVEWCAPGKALVEPGEGATVRYRVGLRHAESGRTVEHLVGGRMFVSADGADRVAGDLQTLADRVRGRADLEAFARPYDHVRPLQLVVHAFPLDPDLPGLIDATDPDTLEQTVGAALVGVVPDLALQECHAQVVQYARRGRCVLRYEVWWRLGASGRTVKQVVYGKVYGDRAGEFLGPAVSAVREHVASGTTRPVRFLVPRFRGYLPELRLVLLEALPGTPRVVPLVRERIAGTAATDARQLTLESAVDICARIAATLHTSGIGIGASRTLDGDIQAARAEVAAIAPLAPSVAALLDTRLDEAAALADQPLPQAFAHGDFTPAQVLFDGPLSGLIDLDTVCLAEPAADLGQFMGYLSLATRKAESSSGRWTSLADDLGQAFVDEYVRVAGVLDAELLARRIVPYRTVSLVRVAARSWRQLKANRLRLALELLDERWPAAHGAQP